MRFSLLSALLVGSALVPATASAELPASMKALIVMATNITDAISLPGRPQSATALDESRKPSDVLAFLGVKEGMKAADLMTGSGYWAELLSRITGPNGHVTAFAPRQFYGEQAKKDWISLLMREPDIDLVTYPFEKFDTATDQFDFAIINDSYHDLYTQSEKFKTSQTDPNAFVKTLYAAMRPGGIVGVIDHVAAPGDTRATAGSLHRIDPATVKADFERAGFVLEAQSDLLSNPDDAHDKGVFDPSIRGHTDRFILKFRKPA